MTTEQDAFQIFDVIFTESPKPSNTYNLRLDASNPDNVNVKIDDILINIFFNGIKTLYGETTTLRNITQEQYENLNKYMQSLGYNTIFEYVYDDDNLPVNVKVWFEQINLTMV
jgi:hypothetical protein